MELDSAINQLNRILSDLKMAGCPDEVTDPIEDALSMLERAQEAIEYHGADLP